MDPLAWMKWIASKARSFHYFQRPYLLPRWLQWICWVAVAWTFYGIFTEVGLVNVYRRYRLSDADLFNPPSTFWIFSPADDFGVLSAYSAPSDQILGLIVATIVSASISVTANLRRSVLSAFGLIALVAAVICVTSWLFMASSVQFYSLALKDRLNDFSMPPQVFWVGGEIEFFGALYVPIMTCLGIALAVTLREIFRFLVARL